MGHSVEGYDSNAASITKTSIPTVAVPGVSPVAFKLENLELKSNYTYHIELTVTKGHGSATYTSVYHLYLHKNVDDEIEKRLTKQGGLPTTMIVDQNDVTRTSKKYSDDRNYYYTTDADNAELALGLTDADNSWDIRLIKTHEAYLIGNQDTSLADRLDNVTGELARNYDLPPGQLKLDPKHVALTLTESGAKNQNRYLFEVQTDKGNRYYTSLTVYHEDREESKLEDLKASEQMTPIFDDDWFEYFVAVPAEKNEAELSIRTKNSVKTDKGSIVVENVRIRDVGGRTLYESPADKGNGASGGEMNEENWYRFPMEPGVNRVTITVTAKFRGMGETTIGGQTVELPVVETYMRAYEVELNRGDYPEGEVTVDKDGWTVVHEENPDTGDIIEMDYTRGGRLAPIWNSDILNYTLAYGDATLPSGKSITLTPTMRTDEITPLTVNGTTYDPRGTFQVELIPIDQNGHRGTTQQINGPHKDAKNNSYFESGDPVKLTLPTYPAHGAKYEVTFITKVVGYDEVKYYKNNVLMKTEYEEHVTTKRYTVMICVGQSTGVDLPELTVDDHHIGLAVYDSAQTKQYPLTPSFIEDFNAYYTEVPYVVDQVKIRVDAVYELITGSTTTEYPYEITINNKPAVSGGYFLAENLVIGDNEFIITLTDPNKNSKTYTLIINRKDFTTTDMDNYNEPYIVDMHVFDATATGGGAEVDMIPVYNQNVRLYNVVVPYAVEEVELKATSRYADILGINNILFKEKKLTAPDDIDGNRKLRLAVGHENFYEIIAYKTDANGIPTGTKIRYIVNILRLDEGYVAPLLDYLGVSEGTMSPVFDCSHNNYYVTVPYDVEELDVIAEGILNESVVAVTYAGSTTPKQTKVVKNVKVNVGSNHVWVYLYDVRTNGNPYYKGVYSLTIDRVPAEGISLDVGLNKQEREGNAAAQPGDTLAKALTVSDSKGNELKFTTAAAAVASAPDIPGRLGNPTGFVNREMNYYVYVDQAETSVTLKPNALSEKAVVTVNNQALDAQGEVQINLSKTVDTVVIVDVKDPDGAQPSQRYSVTFIRRNGNAYKYIIRSLTATMGTADEIKANNTKEFYSLKTNMYRDYDVTEDMKLDKDGKGNVTIELTVPVYAKWTPTPINNMPAVVWETTVTVNGHRASVVEGSIVDSEVNPALKQATYTVTLPVTTYEERFDIRVWIPAERNGDGSYANTSDKDSVEEFILYAYDNSSNLDDRLLEIETDSYGMAVRDENGDPVPALFEVSGSKDKVKRGVTKPTLGRLSILENVDGKKVDTGTLTTRFERNVFHYEATVTDTSAAGTTPTKFYLSASTLSGQQESDMILAQRKAYVEDLIKKGMSADDAEAYAQAHFVGQLEMDAYIEVYDEDGYRRTVTSKINDLEFEFPMVEQEDGTKVQADKMEILIRVTEFAESGHEVISEYTITVYRTEAPILRDLETRNYNEKMKPEYDPVVRYYESEVYDQKTDFNVWALADYGVGYRNAEVSMTAYKTKTAAAAGDTGEVIDGFLYSDPLMISSVSDAKGTVNPSDLLLSTNATHYDPNAIGITSISKTPVINNFYDQTNKQFGVRDMPDYVNEFWVVTKLTYTIGTAPNDETRVGTYVINVKRSRIPVVEGLIDLKAFKDKDGNDAWPLYRLNSKPKNRDDVQVKNTGATSDYKMGAWAIYNISYDTTLHVPTYTEMVVPAPNTPVQKFDQKHPHYMVIMDYTDSHLYPQVEFTSPEIGSVVMKVTYEGMREDNTTAPVTYTMQLLNNNFNGKTVNNNVISKDIMTLDFADDYYKNETFQAHIEFEVKDKNGKLISTYNLLAVRGLRADDEEAEFSNLIVYPGGSQPEVEKNQQEKKNAATLTQGIDDIAGHTHANYSNNKGYEHDVKYYTVYGRTMADKWVNIDTNRLFEKSETLRITYNGDVTETKLVIDDNGNHTANISIQLKDGETESWLYVTGRKKTTEGTDDYECIYVIKIVRENTGKLQKIWIDDYKASSDNKYVKSGDPGQSDYRYRFLWKGTGNDRYDAPYDTLKNTYNKSYPGDDTLVWSPSDPSTDKDTAINNSHPYEFEPSYYNYSVFVDTLTSEMKIAAQAPSTATLEIYQVDPKTHISHMVATNDKSKGMGTIKTVGSDDILSQLVYLDTGLNGEDKFMVRVKEEDESKVGVYYITVYRDTLGNDPEFQLRIKGTTSASYIEDRAAQVQLYKKSDAMGFQSVVEATSGTNPLVKVNPANGTTPTYRERFDALTTGTNKQLTLIGTQFTAPADGEYEFTPDDIGGVGVYMLVMSRPGYLDTVIDNIRVYETYTPAQYDFGDKNMRAGDVNGDGVVDQTDVDLFTKYSSAMNGIYREMAFRLLVQKTNITLGSWNNSQSSGDNFDLSGLTIEYEVDASTKDDLIAKAADYGTTFYYSEKDFGIENNVGSADGSDQVVKELLDSSPVLVPGSPIPDVKAANSGNTGVGFLYVVYTYKSLTAVMKVGDFHVDASATYKISSDVTIYQISEGNSNASASDTAPKKPATSSDPYKLSSDVTVYQISETGGSDVGTSAPTIKKSTAAKKSTKSATPSDPYKIDSDTTIHPIEKPEETKKPEQVKPELTEEDILILEVVDNLEAIMAAENITLGDSKITSANQLVFMTFASKGTAAPTWPTTLPGILDYDKNGFLTVVDYDYIMSYIGRQVDKLCTTDNSAGRGRRGMTPYTAAP